MEVFEMLTETEKEASEKQSRAVETQNVGETIEPVDSWRARPQTLERGIAMEIEEKKASIYGRNKKSLVYLAFSGAAFLAGLAGVLYANVFTVAPVKTPGGGFVWSPDRLYQGLGSSAIVLSLGFAAVLLAWRAWHNASARSDIEVLTARQGVLARFPMQASENTGTAYFDQLVTINVDNLGAYYAQVKAQTYNSFMVSLIVGVIGFLFILGGLLVGMLGTTSSETLPYLSVASGVMTEFIGAVFFYLYSKTVRQMKEYHDSLLAVQNVLLSFKLVGEIKNDDTKASMMGQMLEYLMRKDRLLRSRPVIADSDSLKTKKE
jgi:hypothetical protein